MLFDEVVDDLIKRYSSRGGSRVTVSFHFVSSECSFHDRFVSNGRFCFAIGRGCDICEADDAFVNLLEMRRHRKQIYRMQWRNMPADTNRKFSDFNVFYGCSKNDAPCEIGVFEEDVVSTNGKSKMYPGDCYARELSDIADKFRWGTDSNEVRVRNPVAVVNDVTVNINPRATPNRNSDDDF